MGARIARLRKDSSITQVQLAQTVGVSQQTVTSWEVGRRGMPVSAVPALARALGCTVETLVGEKTAAVRRGYAPKLQQHMERINQLPKQQQRFVMQVLESVLASGWGAAGCPNAIYLAISRNEPAARELLALVLTAKAASKRISAYGTCSGTNYFNSAYIIMH